MSSSTLDAEGREQCMVLVMGVTGAGKSYFINKLTEGSTSERVVESARLTSGRCRPSSRSNTNGNTNGVETSRCHIVRTKIRGNRSLAIVDTPGFNDTYKSDSEILKEITSFLTAQYQIGIPLKGIIYLHRITDNRMEGSARRHLEMFQALVGEEALSNVVLLTTMWDKLADEVEGLDRDQELRERWWNLMEDKGSTIDRFDGSRSMAEAKVILLIEKDPVVLEVQKELRHSKKRLEDTAAAKVILPYVDDPLEKQWLKVRVAEETEQRIKEERKRFSFKDGLQIFAAVAGLAVNVLFNVLPLLGVAI